MSTGIDRSRQALAFLLGATLVGGVLGFTADRIVAGDRLCPRWGNIQQMRLRFGDELGLDDHQRAAVDSILDAKHYAIDALVKPVRPQIDSVTDHASARIKALLTPEQQTTFDAMQQEMKASQAKFDK